MIGNYPITAVTTLITIYLKIDRRHSARDRLPADQVLGLTVRFLALLSL
jgi:hypothetical protein